MRGTVRFRKLQPTEIEHVLNSADRRLRAFPATIRSSPSPCRAVRFGTISLYIRYMDPDIFAHIMRTALRMCTLIVTETHFCGTRVRVARCHADLSVADTHATMSCLDVRAIGSAPRPTSMNISHGGYTTCLLYTSPSPRDGLLSRMPSSA